MTDQFAQFIGPVARLLLGEPNRQHSTARELRYGSRGSLAVNLVKGVWHDHETDEAGGLLDLVVRETKCHLREAHRWLKDHGFELDDRPKTNGHAIGNSAHKPQRRIDKVYAYLNVHGEPKFEVVRYLPKDFRQRRSDGKGGYIWNLQGVELVPYRLPEIAEALSLGHAIFIVEGEKCADVLWSFGIPATCNPMGAGKWSDQLTPVFAGADVVVIPDFDPQKLNSKTKEPIYHDNGAPVLPGQDHAMRVAAAVSSVAARVRVLDLGERWPEIKPKQDIADWFAAGNTVEMFHALVDQSAVDWSEELTLSYPRDSDTTAFDPRFTLQNFDSIAMSTDANYCIKGIIPRAGLAIVWGPPKCGKSFWTFDLVMHVALGREYRGHRVQQGAVVYLALEGGHGFHNRVEAWRRRHLNGHQGAVPFYLLDVPVDLVADCEKLIAAVKAQLVEQSPSVVVIDTLNRALIGDENKSDDMAKFIRAADSIRQALGCAVIIIHHCGVAGLRPRGHSSLSGADDVQIAVERNASGIVTVVVEHMKDGDASAPLAFELERIDLGQDTDGDPITSCLVRAAELPMANGPKLTGATKLAFHSLKEVLADIGEVPPASTHVPPGHPICPAGIWREHFYSVYAGKPDTKQKAFVRATLRLQELHLIGIWNDKAWLARHTGHGQTSDKCPVSD